MPPVWISKLSPQIIDAITEHSICQPGRPLPQGLSHQGSPSFEHFQSAKSVGDLFSDTFELLKSPNKNIKSYQKWIDSSSKKRIFTFSFLQTRCIAICFWDEFSIIMFILLIKASNIKIYRTITFICNSIFYNFFNKCYNFRYVFTNSC